MDLLTGLLNLRPCGGVTSFLDLAPSVEILLLLDWLDGLQTTANYTHFLLLRLGQKLLKLLDFALCWLIVTVVPATEHHRD